jgi:phospholipid/cholesterol/gamma-HCH transport system substrate-binding protein
MRDSHRGKRPPYKMAGAATLLIANLVLAGVYIQFRGDFAATTTLNMISSRAGLSLEPGAKVTYNGVQIGRVARIEQLNRGDQAKAKLTLDVEPRYITLIPANGAADLAATTVFGNKYVSLTSPKHPVPQRITPHDLIDTSSVTTEMNTLFETVLSVSEQVDPVKLNATLTATAQALDGLGDRFGQSIVNGNTILDALNPHMPQIRADTEKLGDTADICANAAPNLLDSCRTR